MRSLMLALALVVLGFTGVTAANADRITLTNAIVSRDAASGLASGKRRHQPIVVTKSHDTSSGNLMRASSAGHTHHCTKGKPCGNTCIAEGKTCRKS
jgi:hypothetical protein